MFDEVEFTHLRQAVADLLPDSCNVLNIVATNNAGRYTHSYGTIYQDIACRFDGTEDTYKVSLTYGTPVTSDNLLQYNNGLYSIVTVNADASWAIVSRLDAKKIINTDECILQVYSGTVNAYGEILPIWTDGATYACQLDTTSQFGTTPGAENLRTDMITVTWDASVRLPITATADVRDRIKVTKRDGVNVTPLIYGIVSPDNLLSDGHHFRLKRVEPSFESV